MNYANSLQVIVESLTNDSDAAESVTLMDFSSNAYFDFAQYKNYTDEF